MLLLKLYASVIHIGVWVLHVARRGTGDGLPEVLLDDLERHIDSCGYTCRGEHPPVLHEMLIILDTYCREGVAHRIQKAPMSGCPEVVQQPGLTQQKGAGANRGNCFCLSGAQAEPLLERDVLHVNATCPVA